MRWAKVPDWLLPALVAVPDDQRKGAAPRTALAVFTAIWTDHADYKTGQALVPLADIADALALSDRAVRRSVRLLELVGALTTRRTRRGDRQGANRFELHLTQPDMDVRLADDPSRTPVSVQADMDVRAVDSKSAGQEIPSRTPVSALYPEETEPFPERALLRIEGQLEMLSRDRSPNVLAWFKDRDNRLRRGTDEYLGTVAAAGADP